jgi:hypothetical protein
MSRAAMAAFHCSTTRTASSPWRGRRPVKLECDHEAHKRYPRSASGLKRGSYTWGGRTVMQSTPSWPYPPSSPLVPRVPPLGGSHHWGRVAPPIAALSGSPPKAPGSAGGYLLSTKRPPSWWRGWPGRYPSSSVRRLARRDRGPVLMAAHRVACHGGGRQIAGSDLAGDAVGVRHRSTKVARQPMTPPRKRVRALP